MIVVLRDATLADCEHVYDWNFASDVRAVSNDPSIVALAQHAAWFADRLTRGAFWIVEYGNEPVGSVRIDDGRISIALAEKVRGRGIGRRAIAAACAAWARPVVAQVRGDNHPSRAAFEACGFIPNETAGAVVTYQWSP